MIGIVNYRLGNLRSVYNAFHFLQEKVMFIESPSDFKKASKIILPGVGNFRKGMDNLIEYGFLDELNIHVIDKKKPCLGICLGMQIMFSFSEEGDCEGLGWLQGNVKKINSINLKTPNIGWAEVTKNNNKSELLENIASPTFYFVHGYYVDAKENHTSSYIDADIKVCSTIEKGNICAVQFHPEKSQQDGLKLLSNFIDNY